MRGCGCGKQERLERERERLAAEEKRERWARFLGPYMRVAVICGGTGPGREASLLSARTLLDQLDTIHHLEAGESHISQSVSRSTPLPATYVT